MWWYLLWWLIICNGCCAAGVAFLNRLHGHQLPEWAIPYGHKFNALSLGLIMLLTFAMCGWWGTRITTDDSWATLTPTLQLVFVVCAVSTLLYWVGVVRRQLKGNPVQELRCTSRRSDIAQELGIPLTGEGPHRWMAGLPGNEIFQLEITERELLIPRLPAAWDGVSILQITDIHFVGTVLRPYFERVLEHAQALAPDLICFTGDLLDDLELMSWLPSTLGRLQAPEGRFFILGNHDQQLDMDVIRREMTGLGWHDVAATAHELQRNGQILHLAGSEYPWVNHQPSFQGVPETALRILLSHTPDNLPQARQERVDLMLSGHVHGGQIRLPVLGPIYCPSRFGCYYAEGLFWEAPTLLHVGRGLAGRQPLRWGCVPEITKLVLRCPR